MMSDLEKDIMGALKERLKTTDIKQTERSGSVKAVTVDSLNSFIWYLYNNCIFEIEIENVQTFNVPLIKPEGEFKTFFRVLYK